MTGRSVSETIRVGSQPHDGSVTAVLALPDLSLLLFPGPHFSPATKRVRRRKRPVPIVPYRRCSQPIPLCRLRIGRSNWRDRNVTTENGPFQYMEWPEMALLAIAGHDHDLIRSVVCHRAFEYKSATYSQLTRLLRNASKYLGLSLR